MCDSTWTSRGSDVNYTAYNHLNVQMRAESGVSWHLNWQPIPRVEEYWCAYSGFASFRVNPRFHPTSVGWNLGLKWKHPTPAYLTDTKHRERPPCNPNRLSQCSVKLYIAPEKCVLHFKYLRYLHKTNTSVFTIIYAITRTKIHLSSTITGDVSLFGYVIYFTADAC